MADFGFPIPAGSVLSYSDPAHQTVVKNLVSRILGATVDFVPVSQLQSTKANSDARGAALKDVNDARNDLKGIEQYRLNEIATLTEKRSALIEIARKEATKYPGDSDEAQLAAYLKTTDGESLAVQKMEVENRIEKVKKLIAAAIAGTDSTMQVTLAQVKLLQANKRIAALNKVSGAVPVAPSNGPSSTTGTATV
jgi:hypothetical protein